MNFGDLITKGSAVFLKKKLSAMQAVFDAGTTPEKAAFQASVSGDKIPLTQRGTANGVATLGASSTIPLSQLPDLGIAKGILFATASSQSTGLTTGGRLSFTDWTGDIAHNGGTQQSTLLAGRRYLLTSGVHRVDGGGGTEIAWCWYNVTAGAFIGASASRGDTFSAGAAAFSGHAVALIEPTVNTQVESRITKVSAGFTGISSNGGQGAGMWALIQELNK